MIIDNDEYRMFISKSYKSPYYYNIITEKSEWSQPKKNNKKINNILPWKKVISKEYGQYYFFNTETGETRWNLPTICNIEGLKWKGNSCYMDSILQSLFGPKENKLIEGILYSNLDLDQRNNLCPKEARKNIQEELIKIKNNIRGIYSDVENVDDFRKLLRNCKYSGGEQFYGNEIRDSGEFLDYLLNMFPISESATSITTTYATNSLKDKKDLIETSKIVNNKANIIISIDQFKLLNTTSNKKLSEFLISEEDSGELSFENLFIPFKDIGNTTKFKRRLQTNIIIDSQAIIFSIFRKQEGGYIDTIVLPDEKITLYNQNKLALSAIVCYKNKHYTCYFKCDNEWYYYDDTKNPTVKQIGSYTNLNLKEIGSQGTQFFYTI